MKRISLSLICMLVLGMDIGVTAADARVAPRQMVVVVLTAHAVTAHPGGRRVELLNADRPITHARTVLPVLARRWADGGRAWLLVRLPGRENGAPQPPRAGWISASHTELRMTPWHIVVDLGARELTVYDDGRPMRHFAAVVGKPSTPTPEGQFFVEEDVILSRGQPGGPFALASSARSNVLREFDGGPGQIAIHGRGGLGGQLGTAESHGCVRLANGAITWLAAHVGAGTPITIL